MLKLRLLIKCFADPAVVILLYAYHWVPKLLLFSVLLNAADAVLFMCINRWVPKLLLVSVLLNAADAVLFYVY